MTSPAVTWLADREAEAIRFLEALVTQDSGTYDRDDVNALANMLAGPLRALGFAPTRFPQTTYGDHWLWERKGMGGKRLLCVSHIDTVFSHGTARARPFSIVGARALGPGVLDMKGGITSLLFALRALAATDSPAWCAAASGRTWSPTAATPRSTCAPGRRLPPRRRSRGSARSPTIRTSTARPPGSGAT